MIRHGSAVWRTALMVFCVLVAVWLVAPSLIVIPLSFTNRPSFNFPPSGWSTTWYANFFSDPTWILALQASIRVGLLVTLVATICGTAAAVALSRTRFVGDQGVRALLLSPMIVPVIVVSIGTYAIYLRLNLLGTTTGFVLAHSVLALPFVIIPVSASLQGFDRRLEDAAAICGANRWATFRTVTLPLVAPGVMSGALFAFATSFDEVVVSLFIQSPYLQTLPVRMYSSVTRDTDPTIAAAATLILALTTALTILASIYMVRRNRVR
ncbi:MAG: putative spermidine/putrescine transport system permease protein [Mycobacterium sp.]|jgi:putative spermidine/putrescine transport system permease protein|nr:putative spermidine/putrescine transport system permease protein [Mycobacterium sp.]